MSLTLHALAVTLVVLALAAQEVPAFRAESRLVRMAFVARDSRGMSVDDLQASELEVRENGNVRPVVGLWRSDLPLSVVILLDVSGSQIPAIEAHRRAIHGVLSHILRGTGEVTLVSFNSAVRLTVARTTSSKDIDDALMSIIASWPAKNRSLAEMYGPALGEPCQGRQKIHDAPCGNSIVWHAAYKAAIRLADVEGRKAIILLTDGNDSGSDRSLSDAIRKSQESETPVYCIAFRPAHGGRTNLNDLKTLAEKTGGLAYQEGGSPDPMWRRIREDLQSTYVLAFRPGADKPGFHRVQVSSQKGHIIRTRPGYFLSH
jgi:VWFA-related protein